MPGCSFGPRPPVQEVTVSVRPSSDNDPGEIVVGYFIVQDGCLVLTDAAGTPLKDAKPEVLAEGVNPKSVAARLTLARWSDSGAGLIGSWFISRLAWPSAWLRTPAPRVAALRLLRVAIFRP
jgi:hypothetical protein